MLEFLLAIIVICLYWVVKVLININNTLVDLKKLYEEYGLFDNEKYKFDH